MNWEAIKLQVLTFVTVNGIKIIAAILILVIGKYLAKTASRVTSNVVGKSKAGDTLSAFVGNMVFFIIMIFVVIAAIGKLGVQTTSFVALIGASGLAIGLALQGTLSNFAAGVMIIIFHPYKIGDVVTAGPITGKVDEIQMFNTIVLTPDNKRIICPNAKMTADYITNFSAQPTRRVDLTLAVVAPAVETARQMITSILEAEPQVLKSPAPGVFITEIEDTKYTFDIQSHVANSDYDTVRKSITEKVKLAFYELNKSQV